MSDLHSVSDRDCAVSCHLCTVVLSCAAGSFFVLFSPVTVIDSLGRPWQCAESACACEHAKTQLYANPFPPPAVRGRRGEPQPRAAVASSRATASMWCKVDCSDTITRAVRVELSVSPRAWALRSKVRTSTHTAFRFTFASPCASRLRLSTVVYCRLRGFTGPSVRFGSVSVSFVLRVSVPRVCPVLG